LPPAVPNTGRGAPLPTSVPFLGSRGMWIGARLLLVMLRRACAGRIAGGAPDLGHSTLEAVVVISAGVTIVAFGVWLFLFAGASPLPLGISL
jgi:hypothetical protein